MHKMIKLSNVFSAFPSPHTSLTFFFWSKLAQCETEKQNSHFQSDLHLANVKCILTHTLREKIT